MNSLIEISIIILKLNNIIMMRLSKDMKLKIQYLQQSQELLIAIQKMMQMSNSSMTSSKVMLAGLIVDLRKRKISRLNLTIRSKF